MRVLLCARKAGPHRLAHQGVDSFVTSTSYLKAATPHARRSRGANGRGLPARASRARQVPATVGGLVDYQASSSATSGEPHLLAPQTNSSSPGRSAGPLAVVQDYVRDGGGLLMIGGYWSFAGIEGPAPITAARSRLPCPCGVGSVMTRRSSRGAWGPDRWPPITRGCACPGAVAGRSRLTTESPRGRCAGGGATAARPMVPAGNMTRGRSAVFPFRLSAPHWAPPEFLAAGPATGTVAISSPLSVAGRGRSERSDAIIARVHHRAAVRGAGHRNRPMDLAEEHRPAISRWFDDWRLTRKMHRGLADI